MSFPYTYKSKIELSGDKIQGIKPDISYIKDLLYKEIIKIKPINFGSNEYSLNYTAKAPLLKYEYEVIFKIIQEENDINVFYEINIGKLINITLLIIILSAFFSFFSVNTFLITAGVFSFLFYSINWAIVNFLVRDIIEKAIGVNFYDFNKAEILSEEQKLWMKDHNRCPACGEYITNIDLYCPDCGLKLNRNKKKLPIDSSKHTEKLIKYHFKKKN